MSNSLHPPSVDVERQSPRDSPKQEKKIPRVAMSTRFKRKDSTSLSVTWEDQMGPIFVRVTDSSGSKAKKTNTRKKPQSNFSKREETETRRYTDANSLYDQPCSSQSLLIPGRSNHPPISDRTPLTLLEIITQQNEKEMTASLAKMNIQQ